MGNATVVVQLLEFVELRLCRSVQRLGLGASLLRLIFERSRPLRLRLCRIPFRRQRLCTFVGGQVAGAGAFAFQRPGSALVLGVLGIRGCQQTTLLFEGFGSFFDAFLQRANQCLLFVDLLCSRYAGVELGLLLHQLQLLIFRFLLCQPPALLGVPRLQLLHPRRRSFGERLHSGQCLFCGFEAVA